MTPTPGKTAIAESSRSKDKPRALIEEMFAKADVRIDGSRPFDIQVRDDRFYRRVLSNPSLGIGESYMDGWWECEDIVEMVARFIRANLHKPSAADLKFVAHFLWIQMSGLGKRSKAFEVGQAHYDLGNDLFEAMLDKRMIYSCAYWKDAVTLEQAQEHKLDLICRKISLKPGMKVLEIGCGWGGWAKFAAEKYRVEVVGLTVSKEQQAYAQKSCAGLPVEFRLQDYRDLPAGERYDKLVSIEMLEAVGHRYLGEWCRVAARAVKPDGLMALQYITCADARYEELRRGVDFIQKHIFPGGLILSANRLNDLLASAGGFVLHALEDMGQDYARTLRAWREEFNRRAAAVRQLGFDERFLRKWNYYLAYCEAAFALRNISVVQTVHTRPNNLSFP